MKAGRVIPIPAGKVFTKLELAAKVPEFGIVRLRREVNGQLTPMLQTWKPEARLTRELPEQLGLEIDYQTLVRLSRGGFIGSRRPSPRLTLISVSSLMQFLKDSEDPDYWTEERRAVFSAVRAEGY